MTSSKPATGVRVHGNGDPQADYWLDGMPMNVSNFSKLLSLSAPSMPMGGLDFKHAADAWVFKSASELNHTEKRIAIGRAHVCSPVTNAHLVCPLMLEK